STAIPPMAPIAHFSGSGCGNVGSYWNFGTCTFGCDCPKTPPSVHAAPRARTIAAAARICFRFMIHTPYRAGIFTSDRTPLYIMAHLRNNKRIKLSLRFRHWGRENLGDG